MAGIKEPILDILNRIKTIPVTNNDGSSFVPTVRIWNNQVAFLTAEGGAKIEVFPCPAFFVEVVNNPVYEIIGQQFRSCNVGFRIHIVHEFYNAQNGTFEQDLAVFDLRDKVLGYLTAFRPTACGPLECMAEGMDYEHTNIYHYIVEFVCNFTDSKGSKYDADHPEAYKESITPLPLEVGSVVVDKSAAGQQVTTQFQINQQ